MIATARHVAARGARVVSRRPLLYTAGPDAKLDRPAHVRAGSALVRAGQRLAIIQDDACFIAFLDPETQAVTGLHYESGAGDVRQFDDTRGNKKLKLDLEAAFVVEDERLLVALGSGSSPLRERLVLLDIAPDAAPEVVALPLFYARLREERRFAGSELNLEGAALDGDDLLLFQRGNGAGEAVDATARLDVRALLAHARGRGPVPELRDVTPWDLGSVDAHRLTFTDGATRPRRDPSPKHGAIAFLACAEDSPDAVQDGPVAAVALGVLDDRAGTAELGLVLDERGAPLLDKAEGLAFDPVVENRAFVVTDRDDPVAPSELLELELGEAWHR